jgi:hypothetical protein
MSQKTISQKTISQKTISQKTISLDENIFNLPCDIPGVNYQLIEKTYTEYAKVAQFLNNYDKFVKKYEHFLKKVEAVDNVDTVDAVDNVDPETVTSIQVVEAVESPENNTDYNRLIPPYNAPCCYSDDGCIKKAAFKKSSNQKLLCWFHVNCQNN